LSGHAGALFSIDVDPTTTVCITGAADNSIKLWSVQNGQCIFTWETKATARFVEISPEADRFLAVTEEHMGQRGSITIFPLNVDLNATQSIEPDVVISNPQGESKVTIAAWSFDGKYIVAGHANGSVSKFDAQTGEQIINQPAHDATITDLQSSPDKTYFITSSKDKTAKLIRIDDLEILKTYVTETPMNSATITPVKDFVILGGGQEARDVTTTSSREGRFESRFFHKLFEDEIGRVKGHFGPINSVIAHPKGTSYASGAEDGYIRVHHFEKSYYDFQYDVERRPVAV
jgi:translation initiation factor 3 subunit I